MKRQITAVLVGLVALAAMPGAGAAVVPGPPDLVSTSPAAGASGQGRYGVRLEFTFDQDVTVTAPATLTRNPSGTAVPVDVLVTGPTVTLIPSVSLASGASYSAVVQPDGALTPSTLSFTTLAAPAHPSIRVKVITALADDATQDMVKRLDRANLLAVPRPQDVVDISLATGRPLTAADLTGYQAALVVTDRDVTSRDAAGNVLAGFAAKGHGVVVGGQAHWRQGADWTPASSLGTSANSNWFANWSPYRLTDLYQVEGGSLKASSISSHFITRYLSTPFTVTGFGSGEVDVQNQWNAKVLARLTPTVGRFATYGQVLVAIRQLGNGRVVDLGFRPWSNAIAGGGFDPSLTAGGALVARSLWWAANRIPPAGTHFTSTPPSSTHFTSVVFRMAASDPDDTHLRYRYRVNSGRWKWAPSSTLGLYYLAPGRSYTVRSYAVDPAGNRDPRAAAYSFRVTH
jgi:hypothetical protein